MVCAALLRLLCCFQTHRYKVTQHANVVCAFWPAEGELREDDDLLEGEADGLEEDLPAEISTSGTEW